MVTVPRGKARAGGQRLAFPAPSLHHHDDHLVTELSSCERNKALQEPTRVFNPAFCLRNGFSGWRRVATATGYWESVDYKQDFEQFVRLPKGSRQRTEFLLLLMNLPVGIHGKRAVKLTLVRTLLKPLQGCVEEGHVLVFPN